MVLLPAPLNDDGKIKDGACEENEKEDFLGERERGRERVREREIKGDREIDREREGKRHAPRVQ